MSALKSLDDFAPQFHLSLQSGSDSVLKAMNRHYTRKDYIEKCKKIYEYFPSAAITTDIIAGFATETEEDFKDSLSIIDEVGFARVHAFCFSPREGTAAFKLKDLPAQIKQDRVKRLLAASKQCSKKFASRFLGYEEQIIAEDLDGEYTGGYTGNYIKVYVFGKLEAGKKYKVILKQLFKDGVTAEVNG